MQSPMRQLASFLDGIVDADPTVVAIVIGAVVVAAVVFVVLRVRGGKR
jgi:hypothetical protein